MVGLGGGSMARFVHQRMPATRLAVVEINPGVVTVARKYFAFRGGRAARDRDRDGARAVADRPGGCDVLVVDGFVNGKVAGTLSTRSFYDAAHAALRPRESWWRTSWPTMRSWSGHCARIEKAFGRPPALLLAEEQDNLIAFALRGGPSRFDWARLEARARQVSARFGLPLETSVTALRERNSATTDI